MRAGGAPASDVGHDCAMVKYRLIDGSTVDLWHRVYASGMKRMTTHNSSYSEISPLNNTISRQCLNRVFRTGRIEATRRAQNGRHYRLIYAN